MQDYSKMYPRRYQLGPRSKLDMVRKVIRSQVSPTLMLAAIIMIVEATKQK